jgi:hypothetical protein
MKALFQKLFSNISNIHFPVFYRPHPISVDSLVNYSIKKYHKTYKLLEDYDEKTVQDPEKLVDSGRLQEFLSQTCPESHLRSTHTSV